ncbi:TolB family protein [Streptomyces zaomyceticus]
MTRTTRTTRATSRPTRTRGSCRVLSAALAVLASSAVLAGGVAAPASAAEAPAADSQRVVFIETKTADSSRTSTIVSTNPDGSDRRELLPVPAHGQAAPRGLITEVVFSKDGLRMAFVVDDGTPDIWTAKADGSEATLVRSNLVQLGTELDELDWSVDGQSLYVSFRPEEGPTGRQARLVRMTADGSSSAYVFATAPGTGSEGDVDVAWDGRLAFVRDGVVHAWDPRKGGEPQAIGQGSNPEFSRDGRQLLFSTAGAGSYDRQVYLFDSGETRTLVRWQDSRIFDNSPYGDYGATLTEGEKPQAVVGGGPRGPVTVSDPAATASAITWAVRPGATPWGQRPHDFGGTSAPDLMAKDAAGGLWLYESDGVGKLEPREDAGWGWASYRLTAVGDLDGDGAADALGQYGAQGDLWLIPGRTIGGLGYGKVKIGWGWKDLRLTGTGDMNGDGVPDVLAIDPTGNLWLYRGDGKGGLQPRVKQGWGFGDYRLTGVGALGVNGSPTVLAQKSNGDLFAYTDQMKSRAKIGHGWKDLTLTGIGDLTGDGVPDVLAKDPAGKLWRYDGDGAGALKTGRTQIGHGWNGLSTF